MATDRIGQLLETERVLLDVLNAIDARDLDMLTGARDRLGAARAVVWAVRSEAQGDAPIAIVVNGREHVVSAGRLVTYEVLVELAGLAGHPSVVYHWRGAGDHARSGVLRPGAVLEIAQRMRIDVAHTGGA
jgi:hypothetical protein